MTSLDLSQFDGHTPAPWELGALFKWSNPDNGVFSGGEYNIFPPANYAGPLALAHPYEPDARLIAAAPALLSEVKALREENAALREIAYPTKTY